MTPEEYYSNAFKEDYNLIKDIKDTKLFSLKSCLQLMELYHSSEIQRILNN